MIVTFGVRNCKLRGLLIESVDLGAGDQYYFKPQNQAIDNHCVQMINIIKASNVKRSKKIAVDISEFIHQYYDVPRKVVWFKGIKLDSSGQQIGKILTKRINIDVGEKKRIFTLNDKKGAKAQDKTNKLKKQEEKAEIAFQKERIEWIQNLLKIRQEQRQISGQMDMDNWHGN